MTKQLGLWNTISLGLMVLCFFLGAGNLIFPPIAGLMAGDNLALAVIGFLVTAVGLPLAGLLALAKTGGGLMDLGRHLPKWASKAIAMAIYLVLVPLFGIPRTCLVAYELGFAPYFDEPGQLILFAYSLFYFLAAMFFVLRPGKLIDSMGKVLMPTLAICIAFLGFQVFQTPFAEIAVAQGDYASMPFGVGFIEGYNTMDALAALMFGILMVDALKAKGVTDRNDQFKYMAKASLVAATGLTLFYLVLFYLGATATGVASEGASGGQIFVAYIAALFGKEGQYLLTAIVTLACFSTAVGGISSFTAYISSTFKTSYNAVAWGCAVFCIAVANIGLDNLLTVSIPVLVGIYPVAMALIAYNLIAERFNRPEQAAGMIIGVAALFGLFDGLRAAGLDLKVLNFLPGFEQGFAWVLPTLAAMVVSLLARPAKALAEEAA
ncbi:branched-chain amino acid transport system II carrier protein [Aliagarivorans taiwanensis]|uniref:branched-chain amino acid transport system II carrier protein n=1 Tax=Aliagarivorans taiwanensis TaxID=561966 RepID=UPI000404AA83|nr:branched-chain amino acid transport system II carrier protein [Aliagarivorans taiwanensis]